MIKCLLPIHGLRLPAKWWCRSSQPSLSSNTMWGMRKIPTWVLQTIAATVAVGGTRAVAEMWLNLPEGFAVGTGMHSVCILNLHQSHHRPSIAKCQLLVCACKTGQSVQANWKSESSSDKLWVENTVSTRIEGTSWICTSNSWVFYDPTVWVPC